MSYCPRPAKTSKTANTSTPATKTVNAPAQRTEGCNASASSTTTGGAGSSTTTTVNVPGLAGPAGPAGADGAPGPAGIDGVAGTNGWGFKWEGEWAISADYVAQSAATPLASVVSHNGSTWVCITDNTSTSAVTPEFEPGVDTSAWSLLAEKGVGGLNATEQTFFDSLKNDLFDWVKNASIGELLLAGAGIILAGTLIADAMSDDGTGDGNADSKYNGTDGYVTTAYTAPDIKAVITSLCTLGGIDFDCSTLPDAECEFSLANSTSIRSILGILSLSYQFDMVDTGGVLKFVPRSTTITKTIPDEDIGFSDSTQLDAIRTLKRFQGTDLPRSVTLAYPAADLDYNNFTQTANLFTYATGQDVKLEVPVTLSHAKAKEIVEVSLINAHLQRTQHSFTTSYKHIDLEPSDVVSSPSMGLIRITQINEKAEGLIQIQATDAGAELATEGSGASADAPAASTNVPVVIGYSQGLFIDPPVLNDADTSIRLYAVVHGYDKAGWPGASIHVSENGGSAYTFLKNVYKESTFGIVATPVASADYHVWDETTSISVTLKTNELTSRTKAEVANGKNWCMIGNEVLGFTSAVLTGPKTYTLTGLSRGRQGTEQYVSTHVANELFVLLDDIVEIDWLPVDRLSTKKYKVMTLGSTLDKASATDVQMVSNNTLLWTPTDGKALKTGADYTVSWRGRARRLNSLRDLAATGNDDDFAGFGIMVMDGSTVKKTYTTTAESWTYTSAMQVADFGSAQSSITLKVAQLHKTYGAGYSIAINS